MANGTPRRTKFPANFVGPQIRRLRQARGWSQSKLAERLQLSGFDIDRGVIAQMESQFHCVRDKELVHIARVLKMPLADFFAALEQ